MTRLPADLVAQIREAWYTDGDIEFENVGPLKRVILDFSTGVIWLAWIEGRGPGAWSYLRQLLIAAGQRHNTVVLDTIFPKIKAFWRHQGFEEIDFDEAVQLAGDHARDDSDVTIFRGDV